VDDIVLMVTDDCFTFTHTLLLLLLLLLLAGLAGRFSVRQSDAVAPLYSLMSEPSSARAAFPALLDNVPVVLVLRRLPFSH